MRVILVSRHIGTLDWFAQKGFAIDEHVVHFDASMIRKGDTVLGVLPVHLAAEVCALGGQYYHLDLVVPLEFRGQELTSTQLDEFGAKLVPYFVKKLETNSGEEMT